MSIYTEMRSAAHEQVANAISKGSSFDGIRATLLIGVIYALLAIAAAIEEK